MSGKTHTEACAASRNKGKRGCPRSAGCSRMYTQHLLPGQHKATPICVGLVRLRRRVHVRERDERLAGRVGAHENG
eukprot:3560567-Pleurochrysis_carterae.AAC.1